MQEVVKRTPIETNQLEKSPTGIRGFDEIVYGGLPKGRTTLVTGGPGSGKTLFGIEFLTRGALQYGEPGVFMAFEETEKEITQNVSSLGIDMEQLVDEKKIFVDYVYIERSEIEETGIYDLEGLFVRLADAVQQVGAKRVVLDTLEVLFAGFLNEAVLRAELRRLFRWLKEHNLTAIVTGERGNNTLTRYGLEEYVSDCVIVLENRLENKIANRILRVLKYRGSEHGTDEYPFLIGKDGIWVMPITSSGLNYPVSKERISSGVPRLDTMLDGQGFFRGSTILISGTAGTGKTSLLASMVNSACSRGEKCLYFAFEESPSQIIRNMGSIGLNLQHWVDEGILQFTARRPSMYGIETHLSTIQKAIQDTSPSLILIDPLSNLVEVGTLSEVKSMLVRLIDFLKSQHITSLFTSLTVAEATEGDSMVGISSLIDTWILLRNLEIYGERNRTLYILKSRGMRHSSQIREFMITDNGVDLLDVYVGSGKILTGSARQAQEDQEKVDEIRRQQDLERRKRGLEHKRLAMEQQILLLQQEYKNQEEELQQIINNETSYTKASAEEKSRTARHRDSD
jgi:circadian clock protein KaiC